MDTEQDGSQILESHFHQTWLWLWTASGDEGVSAAPPALQTQCNLVSGDCNEIALNKRIRSRRPCPSTRSFCVECNFSEWLAVDLKTLLTVLTCEIRESPTGLWSGRSHVSDRRLYLFSLLLIKNKAASLRPQITASHGQTLEWTSNPDLIVISAQEVLHLLYMWLWHVFMKYVNVDTDYRKIQGERSGTRTHHSSGLALHPAYCLVFLP